MFILLLAVSLHQAGCRAAQHPCFFWLCEYNTATGTREQHPQEKLTATPHIVLLNGTINAIGEIFRSSPAELATKPGSKPRPPWSWVKRGDHKTVQTVNSPCSAAARHCRPERCVLSCCKLAHGPPPAETDIILLVIDMRGAVPIDASWESGLCTTCIEFIGSSVCAHRLCLQCRRGCFCSIYSYLAVKY